MDTSTKYVYAYYSNEAEAEELISSFGLSFVKGDSSVIGITEYKVNCDIDTFQKILNAVSNKYPKIYATNKRMEQISSVLPSDFFNTNYSTYYYGMNSRIVFYEYGGGGTSILRYSHGAFNLVFPNFGTYTVRRLELYNDAASGINHNFTFVFNNANPLSIYLTSGQLYRSFNNFVLDCNTKPYHNINYSSPFYLVCFVIHVETSNKWISPLVEYNGFSDNNFIDKNIFTYSSKYYNNGDYTIFSFNNPPHYFVALLNSANVKLYGSNDNVSYDFITNGTTSLDCSAVYTNLGYKYYKIVSTANQTLNFYEVIGWYR